MENQNYRTLPEDFKFQAGKNYQVKYRKTTHRFIFEKEFDMYRHEHNKEVSGYVTNDDMFGHLEYYYNHDEKSKIEEVK